MGAIRILPDRVANQIAAGEVVERPASIVKELLENSLDAGATRVEVEFRNGGRSLIRVEDNGLGMSKDDALLSLERHATSKIAEAKDLDHIRSFGFRGEALPSIASVSRFVLQSRDASSGEGTEITVNGGKFVHVKDCGMPVGTRIVVSNLFNSVPARRKFLKSDNTEAAHIIHVCRLHALGNPQTSFTVRDGGRIVFQSPACESLEERVAEVFNRQISADLLPLSAAEGDLALNGLISKPGVARSSRHEMITFVNRRPVDSRTLAYALLESYQTLVPKGRFPVAFLFLDINPAAVDVNVHPAKREIRFREEAHVRGFTIRTVLEVLRASSRQSTPAAAERLAPAIPSPVTAPVAPARPAQVSLAKANPPPVATAPVRSPVAAGSQSPPQRTSESPSGVAGWTLIGALDGGYSVFETGGGLVLLDRKAAAERVWFERLLAQYREGKSESQRLLLAVPLELDSIAAADLSERLAFLADHGFAIEPFGRDFFRIEGIPVWLNPAEVEDFVRDILGLARSGQLGGRDSNHARESLARAGASRAARGAGASLPAEAVGKLLGDLLRCESPHTSPGGRPTFVEIAASEITHRFQKSPDVRKVEFD